MKNILSPEEAKKQVTYGDLAIILGETVKSLSQESIKYSDTLQENTFKLFDTMTNHMVKIRDNASYERQRDIRYVLNLIAHIGRYDKESFFDNYKCWCEEFDKLNRPTTDPEGSNG